jgi:hypothetical protein
MKLLALDLANGTQESLLMTTNRPISKLYSSSLTSVTQQLLRDGQTLLQTASALTIAKTALKEVAFGLLAENGFQRTLLSVQLP